MLILLDIDGVMVTVNSLKKPELHDDGFPMFSVKSVHALQKIISETNARILLTTSRKTKYSLSKWRDIFRSRGISVNGITRLAKNDMNSNRKDEILNWYQSKHKSNQHFVIIDDDELLNELPDSIKESLVLTSSLVGLTDALADNAIAILNHGKFVYA